MNYLFIMSYLFIVVPYLFKDKSYISICSVITYIIPRINEDFRLFLASTSFEFQTRIVASHFGTGSQ